MLYIFTLFRVVALTVPPTGWNFYHLVCRAKHISHKTICLTPHQTKQYWLYLICLKNNRLKPCNIPPKTESYCQEENVIHFLIKKKSETWGLISIINLHFACPKQDILFKMTSFRTIKGIDLNSLLNTLLSLYFHSTCTRQNHFVCTSILKGNNKITLECNKT